MSITRTLDPRIVDQRLFFLLDNAHMQISSAADNLLASQSGIGRAQAAVLIYLGYNDGCRLSDIAKGVGRKNAAISGLIDRMVAAQLLERQADTDDKRTRHVHLTHKGWRLRETVLDDFRDFNMRLRKGLTDSEIDAVLKFFTLAVDNVEP